MTPPPESNITGIDYSLRSHFRYIGPIIDFHSHVTMTSPADKPDGPAGGAGNTGSTDAARKMLDIGSGFGIDITVSMCPAQDIPPLREALGDRILFNGMINKTPDEADDVALKSVDDFIAKGAKIIKLWSAPRGRDRGLTVDAPWRIEAVKRAQDAGIRMVMVHVGDPDHWWTTLYTDVAKYGSKPDQYIPFRRMMERFPEITWIGAHMGGDPEHPDHLQALLEEYPQLYFDTSATKWQVREVSRNRDAVRALLCLHPDRFLFGTDLVTRHMLEEEHYVSRYWCQRTLWESAWSGTSPIADPDYFPKEGEPAQTQLRGLELPMDVLEKVYYRNAARLLNV